MCALPRSAEEMYSECLRNSFSGLGEAKVIRPCGRKSVWRNLAVIRPFPAGGAGEQPTVAYMAAAAQRRQHTFASLWGSGWGRPHSRRQNRCRLPQ